MQLIMICGPEFLLTGEIKLDYLLKMNGVLLPIMVVVFHPMYLDLPLVEVILMFWELVVLIVFVLAKHIVIIYCILVYLLCTHESKDPKLLDDLHFWRF